MGKTKVLIVEDSFFFTEVLKSRLSKKPNIEIAGNSLDGSKIVEKVKLLKPDVITLDVTLPKVSGLDLLQDIMAECPTPVIIVSGLDLSVFDLLSAGAVDFVKKPDVTNPSGVDTFISDVAEKIAVAALTKVRPKPRVAASKPTTAPSVTTNAPRTAAASATATTPQGSRLAPIAAKSSLLSLANAPKSNRIVLIGASTGGVEAITEIVKRFPANMPPVIVVQHMPKGFTEMFAKRLNSMCAMTVSEAKDGDRVAQGHIYIGPGDLHLQLKKDSNGYFLRTSSGEKVSGHRPSVDVMFDSGAISAGKEAIAVILTGMGRDGASGLLKLRKAGAYTIGQDENSSIVYGMPMVAFNIGAVIKQAALSDIAQNIMSKLGSD